MAQTSSLVEDDGDGCSDGAGKTLALDWLALSWANLLANRVARSRFDFRSEIVASKKSPRRWSQKVTESSNALDLKRGVFKLKDPKKIAMSLKRSAEQSHRRKSDPYRSAMSMLTFYINRAGKELSRTDRTRLDKAKDELRKAFDRSPGK